MATKELKQSDIINHINSDMGQVIEILKRPLVFEVMLNPYMAEDGSYEGHLWYEEAGIGMIRLITRTEHKIANYPTPKIGDKVLCKEAINNGEAKTLSYHVLKDTLHQNLPIISLVLKNMIKLEDEKVFLEQDEHYKLNVFADNIKKSQFHFSEEIPVEQLENLDLLIEEINKRLPAKNILFSLKIKTIETEADIEQFSNKPTFAISKKFEKMTSQKALQIMGILAAANEQHFHSKEPTLECTIPFYHHRFTGLMPPVVKFPTFTIRKHSSQIITLDQYVASGVMPESCRETIRSWVKRHYNIIVAGGTGSGKTTMCNSILDEINKETPQDRVGIIEDTPELQCNVDNAISFCKTNERDLPSLLRTMLRMRPDRIMVGELRGKEAYTLLKAWMSGHPGGLTTIHANGAREAISRFEQCVAENPESGVIPKEQIAYAVNAIISIQKVTVRREVNGHYDFIVKRKVTALREITGYDKNHDIYEDLYYHKDDSPFEDAPEEVTDGYLNDVMQEN